MDVIQKIKNSFFPLCFLYKECVREWNQRNNTATLYIKRSKKRKRTNVAIAKYMVKIISYPKYRQPSKIHIFIFKHISSLTVKRTNHLKRVFLFKLKGKNLALNNLIQ